MRSRAKFLKWKAVLVVLFVSLYIFVAGALHDRERTEISTSSGRKLNLLNYNHFCCCVLTKTVKIAFFRFDTIIVLCRNGRVCCLIPFREIISLWHWLISYKQARKFGFNLINIEYVELGNTLLNGGYFLIFSILEKWLKMGSETGCKSIIIANFCISVVNTL